jgi:site-specific DNA recombinase
LQQEKANLDSMVEGLQKAEVVEVDPTVLEKKMKKRLQTLANVMDELPVVAAKPLIKQVVDKIVVRDDGMIDIHLK